MKVGLAQIDPRPGGLEANLQMHREYILEAIGSKSDLIVFPELSLMGDAPDLSFPDGSLSMESDVLRELSELSDQIDIVVGLIERGRDPSERFNAAFYLSAGRLVHRHRKLFLVTYAVFAEGDRFSPGDDLRTFNTAFNRTCMLVCNDAWHLAMPYFAAMDGAQTLIVPSNSARGTLEEALKLDQTWEHLNRTISAMLGCYTIFVNRVGTLIDAQGEFPYWGGSEIIAPDGTTVVKAPYDEPALVFGEIDPAHVAEQRRKAPVIREARLGLVQQELDRLAGQNESADPLEAEGVPRPTEDRTGGTSEGPPRVA